MSLRGSYYWTTNYPHLRIDVSYSQTARTGTSATYKVDMAVYFTSSGWHGYGFSARCTINGTSQQLRIKEPSNTWSGSGHKGTWSFNITASAGTSGGTLPATIQFWGTEGDSTNISSGSKTVSLSTWNTAPTWTGEGNVNGWTSAQIMPENTSSVTVNFPSASDKEGNTLKYDVWRYVNGSSNAKIATGSTAKSLTDTISGFGQGSKIKYLFKVSDGSLWASGDKWTVEHTKNTFTPASISASGGIGYSTSSIILTVSGAKNTNGNTSFSYRLTNTDGLTIHNPTFTPNSSGQVTFSIYSGSGTRPSNPHIDFSQLKEYTVKGTYTGTLVLRLISGNAYGSSGYKEVNIAIDLRTNPVPASIANPTGTVTVAGGSYFVHNLSTVSVSWSGASDRLGAGALTYELQYKYGTGSWNRLTTTTGTSWSGKLPTVTSATTCYFRVIATTTFGYSATSAEKSITMHYYNPPKVSYRSPNRTTSEFTVYIDSSTNTSISAVAISSRTFTGISGSATSFTGSATLIKDTGLTGDSNYNITVKVTDNSGLSNATTTITVPVTTYIPIMSITNKGIAISTTADPAYKLNIGGSLSVTGNIRIIDGSGLHKSSGIFTYAGDVNGMGMAIQSGGTMVIGSGESAQNLIGTISSKADETMYVASDNAIKFVTNCQTIANRVTATLEGNGTFNATNVQVGGQNVYHTGRKPNVYDLNIEAFGSGNDLNTYNPSKVWVGRTTNTSTNRPADYYTVLNVGANYNSNFQLAHSYGNSSTLYVRGRHDTTGNYTPWAKVYTSQNKPTANDVKAIKVTQGFQGSDWTSASLMSGKTFAGGYHLANGNAQYLSFATAGTGKMDIFLDGEFYANEGAQRLMNKGWCGDIATVATRISNLNTRLNSGWYAWSSNATGRPADYGVMLVIQWSGGSDFCQIAVSTGNSMWTRWYVNGGWTNWIAK